MDAHRIPTRGAIGFLLGLAVLVAAVMSAQAAPPGARLVSIKGTVEILNAPSGQWVAAASATIVSPGAAVRTGPKSQVVLELNGARVTLYETTLIRVPHAAPASTAVDPLRHPLLDSGRALFDVMPRKDRAPFSVRTPTVVAGVKGTVFEVSATGMEHAVYVWDGLVEVTSRLDNTDIQLVAGGQFTVLDDLRLTPALPIPDDRTRPDEVDLHRHAVKTAADERPVAPERMTEDFPIDSSLDSKVALTTEAWRDADRSAVKTALDQSLDFQSVVSIGTVRVSADSLSNTLASTTTSVSDTTRTAIDPVTSTVSSVTDPVTSTVSGVVDPLASTITAVVDPLTSTLPPVIAPVIDPLNSTLAPVVDPLTSSLAPVVSPLTSTVSTVVTPLRTLGF
jgi:hypothetical protein